MCRIVIAKLKVKWRSQWFVKWVDKSTGDVSYNPHGTSGNHITAVIPVIHGTHSAQRERQPFSPHVMNTGGAPRPLIGANSPTLNKNCQTHREAKSSGLYDPLLLQPALGRDPSNQEGRRTHYVVPGLVASMKPIFPGRPSLLHLPSGTYAKVPTKNKQLHSALLLQSCLLF